LTAEWAIRPFAGARWRGRRDFRVPLRLSVEDSRADGMFMANCDLLHISVWAPAGGRIAQISAGWATAVRHVDYTYTSDNSTKRGVFASSN
jgi:hypothetical protein